MQTVFVGTNVNYHVDPLNVEYLMLKWIEKWDGKLPQVNGNDKMIPMYNIQQ